MSRCILDEDTHTYYLDGEPVPGTSRMLEDAGLVDTTWFTPEARDRGTRVHIAGHYLCEGSLDWSTVIPQDRGYVEGLDAFLRESGFVVEVNEFLVWSDALRYATKPDAIGILYGRRAVINWKTGDVRDPVRLQVELEKRAANERILAQDTDWAQRLELINGSALVEAKYALRLYVDGRYKLLPEFSDPVDEPAAEALVTRYHSEDTLRRWREAA